VTEGEIGRHAGLLLMEAGALPVCPVLSGMAWRL
jgi:hypothetical protein